MASDQIYPQSLFESSAAEELCASKIFQTRQAIFPVSHADTCNQTSGLKQGGAYIVCGE
jgi:hypothetical protein